LFYNLGTQEEQRGAESCLVTHPVFLEEQLRAESSLVVVVPHRVVGRREHRGVGGRGPLRRLVRHVRVGHVRLTAGTHTHSQNNTDEGETGYYEQFLKLAQKYALQLVHLY
jgi:hypothetical protein